MTDASSSTNPQQQWQYSTGHGDLLFGGRCLIMGVLNVTPDSFSDGGEYASPESAIRHACQLIAEGADLLDIGGESTRPGAGSVDASEQLKRVLPVIVGIRRQKDHIPISIDTRSAVVASDALEAGADIVNDVSAMRDDPAMPTLLARKGVPFIAMHMQGSPATMQAAPAYTDVVQEVSEFFESRAAALSDAGVTVAGRMIVDPGIGFGKTMAHNLELIRGARRLSSRFPILLGTSRKRFLGEILDESEPRLRVFGTAATVAHAALNGVQMVRVHDVKAMRQVVEVAAFLAS